MLVGMAFRFTLTNLKRSLWPAVRLLRDLNVNLRALPFLLRCLQNRRYGYDVDWR